MRHHVQQSNFHSKLCVDFIGLLYCNEVCSHDGKIECQRDRRTREKEDARPQLGVKSLCVAVPVDDILGLDECVKHERLGICAVNGEAKTSEAYYSPKYSNSRFADLRSPVSLGMHNRDGLCTLSLYESSHCSPCDISSCSSNGASSIK
jgi:hypothetical protein